VGSLTGKPVADEMIRALSSRAERLAPTGVIPCLAVVRVGARADDIAYENSIAARADAVGVATRMEALNADADTVSVSHTIRSLSDDEYVDGILVFRPLPESSDEATALAAISQDKDVDGVTPAQMAGLYNMKKYEAAAPSLFCPCTAEAVIRMLDHYGIPIKGQRAVVIGRSTVIGKPVAHLLLARDASVTICHSKTDNLAELTRAANIVVCAAGLAAAGRAHRLGAEYFAPGQTIIDVAVNADGDGLYGDVDTNAAKGVAARVTPVPGGLGAVTTLILMEHVIRAAERRNERATA
jgi:methylenetetrahydrofolate dehydrogenase (NADP+)/methenyltetrahydrofolate cyclohydrolase